VVQFSAREGLRGCLGHGAASVPGGGQAEQVGGEVGSAEVAEQGEVVSDRGG
jgi:hypothetical protein